MTNDFIRVAEFIEKTGWTDGTLARNQAGTPVRPEKADAVCFCVVGAGERLEVNWNYYTILEDEIKKQGFTSIPYWNDTVGKDEVLRTLRKLGEKNQCSG